MGANVNRIWYDDRATVAKFLMGGIGTGNFSIGSRGQLCDWELFNGPRAGGKLSYTFFALRAVSEEAPPKIRILESRLRPPYERSHGFDSWDSAGIPRFQKARLAGEISRATVEFEDDDMPVSVELSAFSPFIPLDADNSGLPAAVLRYKVSNTGNCRQHISLAATLANPVGFKGHGLYGALSTDGEPVNEWRSRDNTHGIYMFNSGLPEEHLTNGSIALVTTTDANITKKLYWSKSSYYNGAHDFWSDFGTDGQLNDAHAESENNSNPGYDSSRLRVGSLCTDFYLEIDESKEIEFILAWHFPNRPAKWSGTIFPDSGSEKLTKNYYAVRFTDAWMVVNYLLHNLISLERATDAFREAFYQTTLPPVMLDAIAANITVLRSSTCFRIEDGTFLGWEGTFDNRGCCEGNCSHVWNYQQTLAFLFPELERDMRRVNFLLETGDDGEMAYRSNRVFGYERYTQIPPAADGQLGTIIQLYRDWKLSGDDEFLKKMWPKAVAALEFAFRRWDVDNDGILEAEQHNTYDIEFYGMSSMINSVFFAALKAGQEMAEYLGEKERAEQYYALRAKGSAKMDELLFNGEYYVQKLPEGDTHQYQYGAGCLSDQVLGQQLAHMAGLGYILPKEHVRQALKSVFHYNFRADMKNHINVQRVFAINDDAGLINCTWPRGGKPAIPFIYSDEVWTGIEYQVAAHLIYEGFFNEAITIVNAVRARYDGIKRNPWNEVECGSHYVRSMASWGILLAASGYSYDLTKNTVSFSPKTECPDFTCFFSTGKCWGLYRRKKEENGILSTSLQILYGDGDNLILV